jgi:hypothetical protein
MDCKDRKETLVQLETLDCKETLEPMDRKDRKETLGPLEPMDCKD